MSDTGGHVAILGFGLLLLWTASRCRIDWLRREGRVGRLLACAACQCLLWQIRMVLPGIELHLLGTAIMTLMFGWEFALVGGLLALVVHTVRHGLTIAEFALQGWLLLAIPAATAYGVARAVEQLLPRNFFIYVYLTSFGGGALSLLAHGIAALLLTPPVSQFVGIPPLLPYVLLMFGEAFLSGAALTLMVVYRPQWVVSFGDRDYFAGR